MTSDPFTPYECPICYLFMTKPGRKPMTLECGHTLCEECLNRLMPRRCPTCMREFDRAVHPYVLSDLIEIFVATHDVPGDVNPPSFWGPVPAFRGQCTYAVHGRDYISQPWFHCRTCNLVGNMGCCEACASFCHRGHEIDPQHTIGRGYCDCGAGACGACLCQKALASPETVCSLSRTGRCKCPQKLSHCVTCGLIGEKSCCAVCVSLCHAGHEVTDGADSKGYCECCSTGKCTCCPIESSTLHCTYIETRRMDVEQPMWRCRSCRELADVLICDHCAKRCHNGHILEDVGVARSFCRCGVKCTIKRAAGPQQEPNIHPENGFRRRILREPTGNDDDADWLVLEEELL
jgi:hypothetical protein